MTAGMETSEATPRGAVRAEDLAEVIGLPGPFASVYLNSESRIENAAQRSQVRWKSLRRDLEDAGAPERAVAAIDPWIPEGHLHGDALAVLATADGLAHVEHGPASLAQELATWAPLPALATVVAWRQASPPHVTVMADRRGADIAAVRREGPPIELEAGNAEDPIRKVHAGGWSQRRYQQRAENTWEHNARNVAEEVTRLAERVDARIVVVAGDVRAIELLREELPSEIMARLEEVPGGRAEDGSAAAFHRAVDQAVASAVRQDREALLDRFAQELGQRDRAVQGVARTLRALSMAQVDVLFIRNEQRDDRTAWFGSEPTQVAADRSDLRRLGLEAAAEGPLVDTAMRAALGTGAGILVLPPGEGPDEGIGALLRWGVRP
jgi:hypothetical protein